MRLLYHDTEAKISGFSLNKNTRLFALTQRVMTKETFLRVYSTEPS